MGPWASADTVPSGVQRHSHTLACGGAFDLYRAPGADRPALLVLHGLHFNGGRDPRMERFCRVLAACGVDVGAPTLPTYQRMDPQPLIFDEATQALEALQDATGRERVGVLCISLGCLPGTWLAGRSSDAVGGLTLFGAYANMARVLQWVSRDGPDGTGPLNLTLRPVVYRHLLPCFGVESTHHRSLRDAWMRFVQTTWQEPGWETPDRFVPVAEELAAGLHPSVQLLFLEGCNAREGGADRVRDVLSGPFPGHDWMSMTDHLKAVRCPVRLIHGADDDVVPHTELDALAKAVPEGLLRGAHKTGLYGHSVVEGLPPLGVLAGELRALWGSLDAVVAGVPGWT